MAGSSPAGLAEWVSSSKLCRMCQTRQDIGLQHKPAFLVPCNATLSLQKRLSKVRTQASTGTKTVVLPVKVRDEVDMVCPRSELPRGSAKRETSMRCKDEQGQAGPRNTTHSRCRPAMALPSRPLLSFHVSADSDFFSIHYEDSEWLARGLPGSVDRARSGPLHAGSTDCCHVKAECSRLGCKRLLILFPTSAPCCSRRAGGVLHLLRQVPARLGDRAGGHLCEGREGLRKMGFQPKSKYMACCRAAGRAMRIQAEAASIAAPLPLERRTALQSTLRNPGHAGFLPQERLSGRLLQPLRPILLQQRVAPRRPERG